MSGTFLAGGNTKPIYIVDAKLGFYHYFDCGWRGGFTSAFVSNVGVDPPVDRSRVDPNSIKAALNVSRSFGWNHGPAYGIIADIDLVRGEFARKGPASNIVHGSVFTIVTRRPRYGSMFVGLDPLFGIDMGKNLNKPSTLLGTAIDLSRFDSIFRGVAGASGVLGVTNLKEGTNYFTIESTYRARIPATDEPFVRSGYVNGKHATIPELSSRVRHDLAVSVKWMPAKTWGLTAEFKHGALPPLFQMVEGRATIGVLLQMKQMR